MCPVLKHLLLGSKLNQVIKFLFESESWGHGDLQTACKNQ